MASCNRNTLFNSCHIQYLFKCPFMGLSGSILIYFHLQICGLWGDMFLWEIGAKPCIWMANTFFIQRWIYVTNCCHSLLSSIGKCTWQNFRWIRFHLLVYIQVFTFPPVYILCGACWIPVIWQKFHLLFWHNTMDNEAPKFSMEWNEFSINWISEMNSYNSFKKSSTSSCVLRSTRNCQVKKKSNLPVGLLLQLKIFF